MTSIYFMVRSAQVAYPRSQVSIYRTIGPLVHDSSTVKIYNCANPKTDVYVSVLVIAESMKHCIVIVLDILFNYAP